MSAKTPLETVLAIEQSTINKANETMDQIFILGILAGSFIALGAFLGLVIGGDLPTIEQSNPGFAKFAFGSGFSVGVMMVVITGADLYSGNCYILIFGLLNRNANWKNVLKNAIVSYIANFVGAFVIGVVFCWLPYHTFDPHPGWVTFLKKIVEKKANYNVYQCIILGFGCLIMISLSVFGSTTSSDVISKLFAIYFPVLTFNCLGFEHSVSNMFLFPTAMLFGANVSIGQMFFNIALTSIGNILAGSVFMGIGFWYVYSLRQNNKDYVENLIKKIKAKNKSENKETDVELKSVSIENATQCQPVDQQNV